jgi:hypothetical protein
MGRCSGVLLCSCTCDQGAAMHLLGNQSQLPNMPHAGGVAAQQLAVICRAPPAEAMQGAEGQRGVGRTWRCVKEHRPLFGSAAGTLWQTWKSPVCSLRPPEDLAPLTLSCCIALFQRRQCWPWVGLSVCPCSLLSSACILAIAVVLLQAGPW